MQTIVTELFFIQEQLEQGEPQILEEYTGYHIVHILNSGELATKYQVWDAVAKIIVNTPVNSKKDVVNYLVQQLSNF